MTSAVTSKSDHDGHNIHEQEILRVVDHEGEIPRITERNGSKISGTLEGIDALDYRKAENIVFRTDEHDQRNTIMFWKHADLWDFGRDNAGWSKEDRATELCIEANLVDPCVAGELKNIYLL